MAPETPHANVDGGRRPAIHIAGNTAVDVLVRTPDGLPAEAADRWGANTLLIDDPVEITMGGGGAAPAYILGRLGQTVNLNTNIGGDRVGDTVTGWLAEAHVELVAADPVPAATAVHVVQLDVEGRRRSAYFAGDKVAWRHSASVATPDWLLVSGYGRVDDDDAGELLELFATVRERGVRVVFDPSPWFADRVPAPRMLDLWRHVDGLVATEEELAHWLPALSGEDLARAALAAGPAWVVVKRGGEGALFASRDSAEVGEATTETIRGTSSIGAGDTLNGRLVYGLSTGERFGEAVAAAVALATHVVRNGRGVLAAFDPQ